MSIKQDKPHLLFIEKYLGKLETYTKDLSLEEFKENEMTYDACVLNFINLAESLKKLSEDFQNNHPQIPFRKIIGLRNIAAHTYEGLDPNILFDTIQNSIPPLKIEILKILEDEQ